MRFVGDTAATQGLFGRRTRRLIQPAHPANRYLRGAAGFFLLATTVGVALRWYFVTPMPWLPFGNALHAHSHTLYFGWGALALFTLAFKRIGRWDPHVRAVLLGIVAVAAAGFVTFLQGGYSRPSIIVSTVSLCVWTYGIALFWRSSSALRTLDVTFLRVAMVYVGLAGTSALMRVVMIVTRADPVYGRLAVFGFLHCFAAFFLFATVGLLLWQAPRSGWNLDVARLRTALGVLAPLAAFTFPLGVAGAEQLPLTHVARVVACVLIYPGYLVGTALWRSGAPELRALAVCFGAKVTMEAAGALFGLGSILPRHATVLYLHVVLVGFVSGALILLVRRHFGRDAGAGYWLHHLGLAVMSAGLGLGSLPVPHVRTAMVLAAVGGTITYLATLVWALPLWTRAHAVRS